MSEVFQPTMTPSAWIDAQVAQFRARRAEVLAGIRDVLSEVEAIDAFIEEATGERPVPAPGAPPEPAPLAAVPEPEPEPAEAEPEDEGSFPEENVAGERLVLEVLSPGDQSSTRQILAAIQERHPEVEKLERGLIGRMQRSLLISKVEGTEVDGFPVYRRVDVTERPRLRQDQRDQATAQAPLGVPRPTPKPKRKMKHPGVEEMPEHLRSMPAASMNSALGTRVGVAEFQRKVLQALAAEGGELLSNELAAAVEGDVDRPASTATGAKVRKCLHDLEEHYPQFVERTGEGYSAWQVAQRNAPGRTGGGRASTKYRLTPAARKALGEAEPEPEGGGVATVPPPTAAPPAPTAAADTAAPAAPAAPTLERVRDYSLEYVMKKEAMFSPATLSEWVRDSSEGALDWTPDTLLPFLRRLAEMEILVDESPTEDMPMFNYVPPQGPGRAAELERQRHVVEGNGGGGGGPVPGTGRPVKAGVPNVDELLRAVRAAGGKPEKLGNDHWRIKMPDGRSTTIAGTPSRGGLNTDRRKLRGIGVEV